MNIDFKNTLVQEKDIKQEFARLLPEIRTMQQTNSKDDRASILLPESSNTARILNTTKELGKIEYLVVVGIGGSNLGTMAVTEAILGRMHNLTKQPKAFFVDTVDSDSLNETLSIIEPELKKGRKAVINGVSKSGATTETIANFEILVSLLKKHCKNYQKYVFITTDYGSKYWELAQAEGFTALEIPKKTGGRYSVFSPVGLFPLAVLGIDIKKLLKGAFEMKQKCISQTIDNPAAISAIIQYIHYKTGKNISDIFLFSNDLESTGKWHRQLIAESIGKEFDNNGKRVFTGITPTVSIGSTDLHSMAQLYLGGPYDKHTTFVSVKKNKTELKTPAMEEYDNLVANIQTKKLSTIMDAIFHGVKTAFVKQKRPFTEITLEDKSEHSLGQFLQFKMIETMYIGFLMNVNPFDQPNVEQYKEETRRILSKE